MSQNRSDICEIGDIGGGARLRSFDARLWSVDQRKIEDNAAKESGLPAHEPRGATAARCSGCLVSPNNFRVRGVSPGLPLIQRLRWSEAGRWIAVGAKARWHVRRIRETNSEISVDFTRMVASSYLG
jgi:hypothetical protein